jgi:hypothetical protein
MEANQIARAEESASSSLRVLDFRFENFLKRKNVCFCLFTETMSQN